MPSYLVRWEFPVIADTPEDAVRAAHATQQDPDSIATLFTVREDRFAAPEYAIDLSEVMDNEHKDENDGTPAY